MLPVKKFKNRKKNEEVPTSSATVAALVAYPKEVQRHLKLYERWAFADYTVFATLVSQNKKNLCVIKICQKVRVNNPTDLLANIQLTFK